VKTVWDRMEDIDKGRPDVALPKASSVGVHLSHPITQGGVRYPLTCVVEVPPGRWPDWLSPFTKSLRRIQTRNDPGFGFITPIYNTFNENSYVPEDVTNNYQALFDKLKRAATEAGWSVNSYNSEAFDAYQR
jgi:hypothetical protein